MSKYIVEVDAWKMVRKDNPYYGSLDVLEEVQISDFEIYEAITKYAQVKGFTARAVSVRVEAVEK